MVDVHEFASFWTMGVAPWETASSWTVAAP